MRRSLAVAAAAVLMTTGCGGTDDAGSASSTAASPSPTEDVVCFDASYEPAPEGATVARDEVCPQESPSPSAAAGWDVTGAFLPPDEAGRVEDPGWAVDASAEPEAGPLLDPCGDGFPQTDDIVASNERTIASSREAGGSELAQEVFRYRSADVASQALEAYADEVVRCPEVQDEESPEGFTTRFEVVEQADERVRRLLVQRQPCNPGAQCTEHFRSYLLVAQTGDGLTAAHYAIGEDGDPREPAAALLEAVAAQLAGAVVED